MATYTYGNLASGERDNARDTQRMANVARVTYTMLGTEAATETVRIFKASKSSVITGYSIVSDAIATTATVDLGVEDGAVDSVADGIDVAAAGIDQSSAVSNVSADGKEVYLTFATLATPVAGKTLVVTINYDHNT